MADAADQLCWHAPELQVPGDSPRTDRYRLHQSWYREVVLGVAPGRRSGRATALVGNVLDAVAVAAEPALNLVGRAAYQAAIRRAEEVQREGGTLEVERLFRNMLSSMPMCFNGNSGTA
jgi:hypothetical protein